MGFSKNRQNILFVQFFDEIAGFLIGCLRILHIVSQKFAFLNFVANFVWEWNKNRGHEKTTAQDHYAKGFSKIDSLISELACLKDASRS